MIRTILKHEFIRTRGMLAAIFGAAIAGVALGSLVVASRIPILSELGVVLVFILPIVLTPVTQIAIAIDFWRSSFRAAGYLTHAIPVKGSTIFWAKLLWSMIATVAAILVMLPLAALSWFVLASTPSAQMLGTIEANPFKAAAALLDLVTTMMPMPILLGVMLPLLIVLIIQWPVYYAFVASVGSQGSFGRMGVGGPILVGFIAYVGGEIISLLSVFAVPFGIDFAAQLHGGQFSIVKYNLVQTIVEGHNTAVMPLGVYLSAVILLTTCLWLTHRSWNRHVSLN